MLTDISLLKPHPINDKIYSNQSCEDLEASISLNGLLEPLVITKENTVISGHRRLMACKNLNMKKIHLFLFYQNSKCQKNKIATQNFFFERENLDGLNFFNFKNINFQNKEVGV